MTPTKAAEEVTRSLVERVSSGISALPRPAEPQMQRRADQVRSHLAIPNYRAEIAMQQRASDIRENMELPRLKRSYDQMSHSSSEPVSPGPAFPSDPLDLNLDGASMASYMSQMEYFQTKLADPFKPTKESDAQLQMMMLHPQPISEHQSMVGRQVEKARELAKDKHKGPFQVGRHFCLIDPYNGEPVQIAVMKADGMGNVIYKDKFGRDVSKISPSGIGEPMPGKRGEFLGFKEDFGASHLFGPG
ncbi:hypothetical protein Brms1b_008094 [Colletotrichum noveboracense]|nr:hypothetical protein Brms1b_008094 [Colletotrichum noveboracense]